MTHTFLFLQGVNSPFFADLAEALKAQGHAVLRVNFTVGDKVFWRRNGNDCACTLPAAELDTFFTDFYVAHGITDVVLFGDERPVHRPAIAVAKKVGVRSHVFEEGYFRPYWLTLERGGVNANSSLPADPAWYKEMGPHVPNYRNGLSFKSSFYMRAWFDVAYHFCSLANRWQFPQYEYHSPDGAWQEYWPYLWKQSKQSLLRREAHDNKQIGRLLALDKAFYVLPLQLDSDAQIRCHSAFDNMSRVMRRVISSFALHAPAHTYLIIKNHPLDMGLVAHEKNAQHWAKEYGVTDRVVFVQTGSMPKLLSTAVGVVTVNSTVGASSILHALPTKVLGEAIYNMPGLSYQGELDDFWQDLIRPDMNLFQDFRNVVIHATQINGGFYTKSGIQMAVKQAVPALVAERSFIEQHYGN